VRTTRTERPRNLGALQTSPSSWIIPGDALSLTCEISCTQWGLVKSERQLGYKGALLLVEPAKETMV
jgi:hypothetical protein